MTPASPVELKTRMPGPRQVDLDPCPRPPLPGPGGIVLRTVQTLISPGTELAFYTGTHVGLPDPANKWAKYPFAPGYLGFAEVTDAGPRAKGFRKGMTGLASVPHQTWTAVEDPAGLFIPFLPVPKRLDPAHALFTGLVHVSLTAVRASALPRGSTVVVLGLGIVGNLAAQLLQLFGRRVVGVDLSAPRRAAAKACGIKMVVGGPGIPTADAVATALKGAKVDGVVEATGIPGLVTEALDLVRPGGEVVFLGSTRGKVEVDVYKHIHRKGVVLRGAHAALQAGLPPKWPDPKAHRWCLAQLASGKVRVGPLITHRIAPTGIPAAYAGLLNDPDHYQGVVIGWNGGAGRV